VDARQVPDLSMTTLLLSAGVVLVVAFLGLLVWAVRSSEAVQRRVERLFRRPPPPPKAPPRDHYYRTYWSG